MRSRQLFILMLATTSSGACGDDQVATSESSTAADGSTSNAETMTTSSTTGDSQPSSSDSSSSSSPASSSSSSSSGGESTSESSSSSSSSSSSGDSSSTGVEDLNLGEFAPVTEWTVPSGPPGGYDTPVDPGSFAGGQAWRVVDLDGGAVELVVSGENLTGEATVFADEDGPYWRVHTMGNAVSDSYVRWAVPSDGPPNGYPYVRAWVEYDDGWAWEEHDMDGDGIADLVVTAVVGLDGVSTTPGYPDDSHWDVYYGGPGGFDATPIPWALPAGGHGTVSTDHGLGFDNVDAHEVTARTDQTWITRDVNGDGDLDLVVVNARDEDENRFAFQDTPAEGGNWRVHLGMGTSGFEATAQYWDLPSPPLANGWFDAFVDALPFDLNQDGMLDLVLCTPATDSTQWDVYLGDGTSIANTPTPWAIPDVSVTYSVQRFELNGIFDEWHVRDIDLDGYLDFVLSGVEQSPLDFVVHGHARLDPHWEIYRGDGTGFAAEPLRWNVPPVNLEYDGIDEPTNTSAPGGNRWFTDEVTGDGIADLVFPADAGSAVDASWTVYPGVVLSD